MGQFWGAWWFSEPRVCCRATDLHRVWMAGIVFPISCRIYIYNFISFYLFIFSKQTIEFVCGATRKAGSNLAGCAVMGKGLFWGACPPSTLLSPRSLVYFCTSKPLCFPTTAVSPGLTPASGAGQGGTADLSAAVWPAPAFPV